MIRVLFGWTPKMVELTGIWSVTVAEGRRSEIEQT